MIMCKATQMHAFPRTLDQLTNQTPEPTHSVNKPSVVYKLQIIDLKYRCN